MPDLLHMCTKGEPDSDQVGRWQDDAAEIHQWFDMRLEEHVVRGIRLMVITALAGHLIRQQLTLWTGHATKFKLNGKYKTYVKRLLLFAVKNNIPIFF